jgi:hypothetical protein
MIEGGTCSPCWDPAFPHARAPSNRTVSRARRKTRHCVYLAAVDAFASFVLMFLPRMGSVLLYFVFEICKYSGGCVKVST